MSWLISYIWGRWQSEDIGVSLNFFFKTILTNHDKVFKVILAPLEGFLCYKAPGKSTCFSVLFFPAPDSMCTQTSEQWNMGQWDNVFKHFSPLFCCQFCTPLVFEGDPNRSYPQSYCLTWSTLGIKRTVSEHLARCEKFNVNLAKNRLAWRAQNQENSTVAQGHLFHSSRWSGAECHNTVPELYYSQRIWASLAHLGHA